MITLQHIKTKRTLVKSNKDADIIMKSPLGKNYKVIQKDKVEDPPETRVSIKPKKPKEK